MAWKLHFGVERHVIKKHPNAIAVAKLRVINHHPDNLMLVGYLDNHTLYYDEEEDLVVLYTRNYPPYDDLRIVLAEDIIPLKSLFSIPIIEVDPNWDNYDDTIYALTDPNLIVDVKILVDSATNRIVEFIFSYVPI